MALTPSLRLLLIDDSNSDAELMTEALRLTLPTCVVTHASSAEQGLRLLAETPCDLIVTDLNLPGLDGIGLLHHLKRDARTRALPVLVLTGSASEAEVHRAYAAHASAVLHKGVGFSDLQALAEALLGYWGDTVRLPTRIKSVARP